MNNSSFYILSFCFCSIVFFQFAQFFGISPVIIQYLNVLYTGAILIYCRDIIGSFLSSKFKTINFITLAFCLIIALSAYVNKDNMDKFVDTTLVLHGQIEISAMPFSRMIWFAVKILLSVLFLEKIFYSNMQKSFSKFLFVFLLLYCIYSDLNIYDEEFMYLISGKFSLCYMHLYMYLLFCLNNYNSKYYAFRKFILFVWCFYICYASTCTTLLLGFVVFAGIEYLTKHLLSVNLLYKKRVILTVFLLTNVFFFFLAGWLLTFPIIQEFVVNVLHEDLTLTNRLIIYQNIQEAFTQSPLIGFGVGNYLAVATYYTGFANAQNGIFNLFLEVGIVGVSLFILWLYGIIKDTKINAQTYLIMIFLYSQFVVGMVEIPFSMTTFYAIIAMLLLYKDKNERENALS